MVEPIGPEVYLAIASVAQGAVHKYKDKRHYKQQEKLFKLNSEISSWRTGSSISGSSLGDLFARDGLELGDDGSVQWRMDNPALPRNWSKARKGHNLGLLIFLNFFMSAMSNAGTPASSYALKEFRVSRTVGLLGFTTLYLIGLALGHFAFSPFSETFGRKRLYIASAFLFSVFCIPVAATQHIAAVFICRFITGFVSATPRVTVSSSIRDLLDAESEDRSYVVFLSSLTANLGIVVGPVFGSQVAAALNWRWIFYLAAIIASALGLLLFTTSESQSRLLLDRKIAFLQSSRPDLELRSRPRPLAPDFHTFIQPLTLLFSEPIVYLTSLTSAFAFGLLYLLPVALPLIYAFSPIKFTQQKSLLLFLFAALGLLLSILTRFYERHVTRRHQGTKRLFTPEKKLLGFVLAAPLLTVSLWWFTWTVPPLRAGVPWAASSTSLLLLGFAVGELDIVLTRYLRDSYTSHSGSAGNSMAFLQALFGGVFPIFTTPLYTNMNHNLSTSILAIIATIFCIIPIIFLMFGKKLRGMSKFARESLGGEEIEAMEKVKEEKKRKREEKREKKREDNRAYVAAVASMGMDVEQLAVYPIW